MHTFIKTGKVLAPNDYLSEDSEVKNAITFEDIVNYFPYLKNLEQQCLSPEDFYHYEPMPDMRSAVKEEQMTDIDH